MKFNLDLQGKVPAGAIRLIVIIVLALLGYEGGVLLGLV